jgi:hypothetical protein
MPRSIENYDAINKSITHLQECIHDAEVLLNLVKLKYGVSNYHQAINALRNDIDSHNVISCPPKFLNGLTLPKQNAVRLYWDECVEKLHAQFEGSALAWHLEKIRSLGEMKDVEDYVTSTVFRLK